MNGALIERKQECHKEITTANYLLVKNTTQQIILPMNIIGNKLFAVSLITFKGEDQ